MEHHESPGLNPKKTRNINTTSLEVMTKMAGVIRTPSVREGLLVLVCFVLLITLLQINIATPTRNVKVGQVCTEEIRAPKDVEDSEATKMAQEDAWNREQEVAQQDPSFYKIDSSIESDTAYKLNRFFEIIDQERVKTSNKPDGQSKENIADLLTRLAKFLYKAPNRELVQQLIRLPDFDYQIIKERTHRNLKDLLAKEMIDANGLARIYKLLPSLVEKEALQPELQSVLLKLLTASVQPNLIMDQAKLIRFKDQVTQQVPKVMIRANEILIAKNQVITENDMKMLKELHLITDESNRVRVFLSLSFFVLLMVVGGLIYIFQFHSSLFKQERLLYLLLMLLVLVIGLIKALTFTQSPMLPYMAPVSFATILISILISPQLALAMAAIFGLLGGIIVQLDLSLTVFYFVSGVVSVFSVYNFHRQRDLVRTGLILMGVNAVTAIGLNLLFTSAFRLDMLLFAVANGFLSAVLAIGSLPFIEHLFGLTSAIRLLELSNPGHPLLRRLQIEAPGTYHHSIMVGNLAEAAAEGIGADTLWVRVGSYYHDIGKIKRPYFFVENQFGQDNPHEKLNPTLSTLIITYHVKEGAEIAREHGLPEKLIAIIEQHHGTDLVRYFYKRATETVQGEREVLIEEDFRYEGPKPRSKEAALVMLADSVEAAVRALPKPTPAKVEALIQKIIRERLDDGQFDECDLTLKDLNKVKNSFLKVLGGLFHNRIEYPETVLNEIERKKASADPTK